MSSKLKLLLCAAALTGVAACEGTDTQRGAMGAAGAAGTAYALGADKRDVVAAGVAGGVAGATCDDLAPRYCQ